MQALNALSRETSTELNDISVGSLLIHIFPLKLIIKLSEWFSLALRSQDERRRRKDQLQARKISSAAIKTLKAHLCGNEVLARRRRFKADMFGIYRTILIHFKAGDKPEGWSYIACNDRKDAPG